MYTALRLTKHRRSPRGRTLLLGLGLLVLALVLIEAYRVYRFTEHVAAARGDLLSLRDQLDIASLNSPEAKILDDDVGLRRAHADLQAASTFVKSDPLVKVGTVIPILSRQVKGLRTVVLAAEVSAETAVRASQVALAFARHKPTASATNLEDAIIFLRSQEQPMAEVQNGLDRLEAYSSKLPGGLVGPLDRARDQLDEAIAKLRPLVEGYTRADRFLPDVLGFNGARRYLILPQNNTELLPSGGLISSYGIATFDNGRLVGIDLEYFGTLYERWQRATPEYITPPAPLRDHLLKNFSWALGEAGWYPDFPTTAKLARMFVDKGGAPPTDGTIAIDLPFVSALLTILGPINIPEYGVTVTPENVSEVTLAFTRGETYVPGESHQAFLSFLAKGTITKLFSLPKERWIDLLRVLDRMGNERHLQLFFNDEKLQSLSRDYGFDGGIVEFDGDFLLIADSSVNSTKLNLILKPSARLNLELSLDGSARSHLTFTIENPFDVWKIGRDPNFVRATMLGGVYGCFLRVFLPPSAQLGEVRVGGIPAGASLIDMEVGKLAIGRFFTVLPGATNSAEFTYTMPSATRKEADGLFHYRLYIQKEAGTDATPLVVRPGFPSGSTGQEVRLDGKSVPGPEIVTDLRVDRSIELVFRLP